MKVCVNHIKRSFTCWMSWSKTLPPPLQESSTHPQVCHQNQLYFRSPYSSMPCSLHPFKCSLHALFSEEDLRSDHSDHAFSKQKCLGPNLAGSGQWVHCCLALRERKEKIHLIFANQTSECMNSYLKWESEIGSHLISQGTCRYTFYCQMWSKLKKKKNMLYTCWMCSLSDQISKPLQRTT